MSALHLRSASRWSPRSLLVCAMAASVGLPMAWISLSKVAILLTAAVLSAQWLGGSGLRALTQTRWSSRLIGLAILVFALSLLWTQSPQDTALWALAKHAKLLLIPALLIVIRSPADARLGLQAFVAAQIFVLLSSWLLAMGLPLPWVQDPVGQNVVFSSYLDQSIMLASSAAVLWHLRHCALWPAWLGAGLAVLALLNATLMLDGRTGYAVAITVLSLATMWAVPARLRIPVLLISPVLVLGVLYFSSSNIQHRIAQVWEESRHFSQSANIQTSSGWRLNAWHRSLQAIQERPWTGHGVGSWTPTVKRIQGANATKSFGTGHASNPHQEFLLWSVELGVLGGLLYAGILASLAWEARRFSPAIQRSAWSILAAMAVASLFNSIAFDDRIGDFFCVSLGLLFALGWQSLPSHTATHQ